MIIIIGKKREGMISMFLALPTKTTLICKIVIILGMFERQQSKTNRDNTKKKLDKWKKEIDRRCDKRSLFSNPFDKNKLDKKKTTEQKFGRKSI